jgi:hypothetical protein
MEDEKNFAIKMKMKLIFRFVQKLFMHFILARKHMVENKKFLKNLNSIFNLFMHTLYK